MHYSIFGQRTGLKVAELAWRLVPACSAEPGAIGPSQVRCAAYCRAIYLEAGGNLMDTVDNYQHGESERMIDESSPTTRSHDVYSSPKTNRDLSFIRKCS
jgi:aryl-alcohol dehydrogenase-like predicted oxidoreductase